MFRALYPWQVVGGAVPGMGAEGPAAMTASGFGAGSGAGAVPPEPFFPPPVFSPRPAPIPAQFAKELTADPLTWFNSERLNLLAAVDLACAAGQFGLARELADAQCAYQHRQDRHDDAERSWTSRTG